VFVYGDSLKAFLIAIVVPDEENLTIWAKENNIGDDWINLPQTKELIFNVNNRPIKPFLNKLNK